MPSSVVILQKSRHRIALLWFCNHLAKFMLPKPDVGNSPPFWNESPFRTFTPKFQPEFVVVSFDELVEMEIRSKKGTSCRRLVESAYFIFCNPFQNLRLGSIELEEKMASECWSCIYHKVPAVGNSPLPFLDKPAFSQIPWNCGPQIVMEIFEEFVNRKICQQGCGVEDDCINRTIASYDMSCYHLL